MRNRTIATFVFLLIFMPVLLFSQNNDSDGDQDQDETEEPITGGDEYDVYDIDIYASGDQIFMISLGTVFPAVFLNYEGNIIEHNFSPPVGGVGTLSWSYYITPHIFFGAEISGTFIPTVGLNTAFLIPLGVKGGYQFNVWKFEFPVYVTLGMTWHRFLNMSYYGFYMRGGFSAFFRFNPEWSFGIDSNWGWFPEWTEDPKKNIDGNIVTLTLCARYHF